MTNFKNKTTISIILTLLVIGLIVWKSFGIIVYLIISLAIGIVGSKVVDVLDHKIKAKIPAKRALLSISFLIGIFASLYIFFSSLIPHLMSEAQMISEIDLDAVGERIEEPLLWFENEIKALMGNKEASLSDLASEKIKSVVSLSKVSVWVNSFASLTGNIFIGLFSVTFISFFFIKDGHQIFDKIISILPVGDSNTFNKVIERVKNSLRRYFTGILIETTTIFIVVSLVLWILGIDHFILIGLFAGIINVIPYIGPIIGMLFGLVVVIASNYSLPFYEDLLPMMSKVIITLLSVQLLDNFVLQPIIYSSSVNAHPLEIFLVILVAGNLAGIMGMIFAVPVYTIIRIVLKEYLSETKIQKKILTQK